MCLDVRGGSHLNDAGRTGESTLGIQLLFLRSRSKSVSRQFDLRMSEFTYHDVQRQQAATMYYLHSCHGDRDSAQAKPESTVSDRHDKAHRHFVTVDAQQSSPKTQISHPANGAERACAGGQTGLRLRKPQSQRRNRGSAPDCSACGGREACLVVKAAKRPGGGGRGVGRRWREGRVGRWAKRAAWRERRPWEIYV